ncbi:hypothetical protein GUITHDRAFT_142636 [Guillardia theta CCMP2712]|uniref:Tyrosine-protein kinase ephrin type A/B receptor-like domain-containing protein n=1 Tax=Guillardia theta (strain CCMP2712) TaxID=905079 RepID=L1IXE6_GUITC|nr:hypothetical protein GUITHDRAFT_142636 [Guillardia theta CCMP2712]EKX40525.1 hypothetical protein GUITHDRAFT_142636 [Guillardia theta CCMP2712]|eukprot:XP_005827505.1 hypothetical protein GUITHDRAFT_142636 [Guillardia theta CCMP2712]
MGSRASHRALCSRAFCSRAFCSRALCSRALCSRAFCSGFKFRNQLPRFDGTHSHSDCRHCSLHDKSMSRMVFQLNLCGCLRVTEFIWLNSSSPALSVNSTSCKCFKGFVLSSFSCSVCPDSDPGSTSEDNCYCRSGYVSGVRFCNPGYTGSGNGLDPCVPSYKGEFGNIPCTYCPYNLSSPNASTSIKDCITCERLYNILYKYDNETKTCRIPQSPLVTEDQCPQYWTFPDGVTLVRISDCSPNCNKFFKGIDNHDEWYYKDGQCLPVIDQGNCTVAEYFDNTVKECILLHAPAVQVPRGEDIEERGNLDLTLAAIDEDAGEAGG